jgi:sugar lactone lactonase YvrE
MALQTASSRVAEALSVGVMMVKSGAADGMDVSEDGVFFSAVWMAAFNVFEFPQGGFR